MVSFLVLLACDGVGIAVLALDGGGKDDLLPHLVEPVSRVLTARVVPGQRWSGVHREIDSQRDEEQVNHRFSRKGRAGKPRSGDSSGTFPGWEAMELPPSGGGSWWPCSWRWAWPRPWWRPGPWSVSGGEAPPGSSSMGWPKSRHGIRSPALPGQRIGTGGQWGNRWGPRRSRRCLASFLSWSLAYQSADEVTRGNRHAGGCRGRLRGDSIGLRIGDRIGGRVQRPGGHASGRGRQGPVVVEEILLDWGQDCPQVLGMLICCDESLDIHRDKIDAGYPSSEPRISPDETVWAIDGVVGVQFIYWGEGPSAQAERIGEPYPYRGHLAQNWDGLDARELLLLLGLFLLGLDDGLLGQSLTGRLVPGGNLLRGEAGRDRRGMGHGGRGIVGDLGNAIGAGVGPRQGPAARLDRFDSESLEQGIQQVIRHCPPRFSKTAYFIARFTDGPHGRKAVRWYARPTYPRRELLGGAGRSSALAHEPTFEQLVDFPIVPTPGHQVIDRGNGDSVGGRHVDDLALTLEDGPDLPIEQVDDR